MWEEKGEGDGINWEELNDEVQGILWRGQEKKEGGRRGLVGRIVRKSKRKVRRELS